MAKTKRAKNIPENIPATPFASWVEAMGLNRKQVAEAGERVGLSRQAAGGRNRGSINMNDLELLGLTAAFFKLPPWSADLVGKLDDRAKTMLRLAAEDVARCLTAKRK